MLAEQQLATTAYRLLAGYLDTSDLNDNLIANALDKHWPNNWPANGDEEAKEIAGVRERLEQIAADLLDRLTILARAEGIDLKENAQ